jgi:UDPglucose 6-dehydrogenase
MSQNVNLKISIVGTGYVGLVTGLCLCECGHNVTCIDLNAERITQINQGITPIYEQGLDDLLNKHLGDKFHSTTDLETAVIDSDITIIAVGTPSDAGIIDLNYIKQASQQIGRALKNKESYHVVAVKSTVIPGSTDEVVKPLLEEGSGKIVGLDIGLCMNPEFLREGQAVQDFLYPDRIIIGGVDNDCTDFYARIFQSFDSEIIKTNNRTAEMTKYTSNALLGTFISFANEIANICEKTKDVDVTQVLDGVFSDRRMHCLLENQKIFPGFVDYLKPGCGFGGSCFPKDISALQSYGKINGVDTPMLNATLLVNKNQPEKMISHLLKYFTTLDNIQIGVLGIAFKPGTDDIRCSPAISIIRKLLKLGAHVTAYDSIVNTLVDGDLGQVTFATDVTDLLARVDAVMVCSTDDEFMIVPEWISINRPELIVIDGRRRIKGISIKNYSGIGKY